MSETYKELFVAFMNSTAYEEVQKEKNKVLYNLRKDLEKLGNTRDEDMFIKGKIEGVQSLKTIFDRLLKAIQRGSSDESRESIT